MLSSSRLVQSFVLEYGDKGYEKLAKGLSAIQRMTADIVKNQRQIGNLSNIRNTMGRETWKDAGGPAAMREQTTLLKQRTAALKEYTGLVKQSGKNLQFMQELTAATPGGRVLAQWQKLSQVFRRVADALISFVVINTVQRAISGFFSSIIGSNIQLQTLETRLLAITKGTGGSFKELRDHIVMLTVKTPFMIRDFADAAVTLKAFGLDARQALLPIADWATAIGKDLPDVATAFSKIAQGSPRTALLLSTRGISKKEFDAELMKTKDRVVALTNIIERQFGGMAFKVSRTFEGMTSNIKDAWFLLSKQIGFSLFEKMNKDVEKLYYSLMSANSASSQFGQVWVGVGEILAGAYTTLKLIIPILGAAGIYGVVRKIVVGFQGMSQLMGRFGKFFGAASGVFMLALTAASMLLDRFVALETIKAKLTESESLYNEQVLKGNKYGQSAVDALKAQLDAQKELYDFQMSERKGELPFGFETIYGKEQSEGLLKVLNESLRIQEAKVVQLEREYATSKAILEINQALRDVNRDEMAPHEVSGAFEIMAKKWGGREAVEAAKAKVVENMKKYPAYFANKALEAQNIAEGGVAFREYAGLRDMLREFDKLLAFTPAKGRQDALSTMIKDMQKFVDWGKKYGRIDVKFFEELLSNLVDEEKTKKAAKEYANLSDEIAQFQQRLKELRGGEGKLPSQISGHEAAIFELQRQRAVLAGDLSMSAKNTYEWDKNELDILKHQVALLEAERTLRENIATAMNTLMDASRGLQEQYFKKLNQELQIQYDRTADVGAYYEDINLSLKEAASRHEEIKQQMVVEQVLSALMYADTPLAIKHLANAIALNKELLAVEMEMATLQQKLWQGPSQEWMQAIEKVFVDLKKQANSFYDDVAKDVITSVRDFISGALWDVLFGTGADSTDEKITGLRMEIEKLNAEASQTNSQYDQIRRRESETSEAYMARIQVLEEIQAVQAQTYIFKTKEMELMEQINAAERERSNIVMDRLRNMATSLSQKIMDSLVNMFVSSLWGSGGSAKPSGGGGNGVVVPDGFPQTSIGKTGAGNGSTIIVTGNNVYGMDDFSRMVDDAVKSNSYRRTR